MVSTATGPISQCSPNGVQYAFEEIESRKIRVAAEVNAEHEYSVPSPKFQGRSTTKVLESIEKLDWSGVQSN